MSHIIISSPGRYAMKALPVAAGVLVLAAIISYAVSPYFLESEIYEELPDAATEVYGGTFVGVGDGIHDAQGTAQVLSHDDSYLLRLEQFRSTNGPDLYVYLSTDRGISDYINLGKLKANMGNQTYDIPAGTDLDKYDTVLIWCKPFSVLFGSAQLLENSQVTP